MEETESVWLVGTSIVAVVGWVLFLRNQWALVENARLRKENDELVGKEYVARQHVGFARAAETKAAESAHKAEERARELERELRRNSELL